MGTSSSSSGPESGVAFDPPWLDAVVPATEYSSEQIPENSPKGRFGNARRYLGEYVKDGDKSSLVKALGNYSRKGMGGAAKLSKRMRASTSAGAGLFNFLQETQNSSNPKVKEWVNQLSSGNLSAQEFSDEIIEQILSTGGSLDEESCRNSMSQALSDILTIYPNVDLLKMDNDSIWTVMELFLANEAFNRICLDIGQLFESSKFSPQEAVSQMNDMKAYLKAEISAQIQETRSDTANPTTKEINNILQSALRITFEIFEGEI